MKPSAVVIILRKNQVFDTAGAIVHKNYGTFNGFLVDQVPAARRSDNPIDGYGVGLALDPSRADYDFHRQILFPTENDVCDLLDAFIHSDELTQKLLGRSWTRPRGETEELVVKVILRLITVSPDFAVRLARRIESSSKRLAKLLKENARIAGAESPAC